MRSFSSATTRRALRPLKRTQSINSGSTLLDDKTDEEQQKQVLPIQEAVARSLVGANVHGTYNAQRERSLWMRKPLFARPGLSGFSSGEEAVQQLEEEAHRRDPYQVDFFEALQDVTRSIVPLIEAQPSHAWVMKQLMEPESFMTFRISWKDDANNWRMNRGYRIQYSSALGPFRGPIRFDHRLTHGTMRMLGFEQVFKHALLLGENWGGASAGADLDVSNKSPGELVRFSRAFSKALNDSAVIKEADVLDLSTELEVSLGRFAGFFAQQASGTVFGSDRLSDKKCILSGCSAKTFSLAKSILKFGGRPISLSDGSGFILHRDGFDLEDLISLEKLINANGKLEDFRHVSKACTFHSISTGKSLWEVAKGDVAFPSVQNSELSSDDAHALAESGCKAVFEVYDRSCSENAAQLFIQRKVLFAPSKLVLAAPFQTASDSVIQGRCEQLLEQTTLTAQEYGFRSENLQAGASILAFKRIAASEMFKT